MSLTDSQRHHLRRLGHHLKPVVRTGNAGLSEAVLNELDIALRDHELVKVKLVAGDRDERRQFVEIIEERLGAELVQSVGHVALLYRPNPEKKGNRIALP
ncbi:ribosome assembly RNA-binding protein YhbY [Ectothiorhodospiraceae bacterium WFHF3C12]|nr:ribosome assembly RNA-binding protein YhbY [Ectothiorhodospiraceae bacterium WFHF3C12]